MSALHDVELADRVAAKLDDLDDKTIEAISSGNIPDWGQYRRKGGYRKALADVRKVLSEKLEDILKE